MASASSVLLLIGSVLSFSLLTIVARRLRLRVARLLVQRLMDEGDCNRSFPHGRCHAFDIAAPDIADREDAGQTRLEEMRRSGERPFRGGQVVPRKVWSR